MPDIVAGIILAAGAAERMGERKLLLPYRGATIIEATVSAMHASAVDRVIVVTGAGAVDVERAIDLENVTIARNPDYRRGNMSSLLAGTDVAPDAVAFVLVAGDLPDVRTAAIDAAVSQWRASRPWAIVTGYRDRVAHPFVLSREAVTHTRTWSGDKVLWRALVDPGDDRVVLVHAPFHAPTDVNTKADYEALLAEG